MPSYYDYEFLDDRDFNYYKELGVYDRWREPRRTSPATVQELATTSTSGAVVVYDAMIMRMSGFAMSSALSEPRLPPIEIEPSTEELWMRLIGVFESGDPDFAINHDEIYGRK